MKFISPPDLWDQETSEAVFSGKLKLQRGQWVRCGSNRLSRFIKVTATSIWAVHPEGAKGVTRQRFAQMCKVATNAPYPRLKTA